MSGNHLSVGTTLIAAHGGFTDDFLGTRSDLKNPVIPVPNVYITTQIKSQFTAGIGLYARTVSKQWDPNTFSGRFLGYNTDVRSIYINDRGVRGQPRLKVGAESPTSRAVLTLRHARSVVPAVPPTLAAALPRAGAAARTTFGMLGVPTGTDFADANLHATGSGVRGQFGDLQDQRSPEHRRALLTRKTIKYSGTATFVLNRRICSCLPPSGRVQLCASRYAGRRVARPGVRRRRPLSNGAVSTSIIIPPPGSSDSRTRSRH